MIKVLEIHNKELSKDLTVSILLVKIICKDWTYYNKINMNCIKINKTSWITKFGIKLSTNSIFLDQALLLQNEF